MNRQRWKWLFMSPTIIVLLGVGIFPILYMLYISFHRYKLTQMYLGTPFIWFENYVSVLTSSLFQGAMYRTLLFFLLTIPAQLVLGILLALMISRSEQFQKLETFVRIILVIPLTTAPVVVGLVARLMFNRSLGVVNHGLSTFGISPIPWLGKGFWAMITISLCSIWQWTPFVALVALAGLTAIPRRILEATRLETESLWQTFRYIYWPYLKPAVTAVLVIRTADLLKQFGMVYTLTRGGPGVSTEIISLYIERVGFRVFDMGRASAMAVLMLILAVVISQVYIRVFYGEIETT